MNCFFLSNKHTYLNTQSKILYYYSFNSKNHSGFWLVLVQVFLLSLISINCSAKAYLQQNIKLKSPDLLSTTGVDIWIK